MIFFLCYQLCKNLKKIYNILWNIPQRLALVLFFLPLYFLTKTSSKNNEIYTYFFDFLKQSSRSGAKNCMYRILMAGQYHDIRDFKYWLWGPFHYAYHARPFCMHTFNLPKKESHLINRDNVR